MKNIFGGVFATAALFGVSVCGKPLPSTSTPSLDLTFGTRSCLPASTPQKYWYELIAKQGASTLPWTLPNVSDFHIFRNVKDYGAAGDGSRDAADAIQRAIDDGHRCGGGQCDGYTGRQAIVYLPGGTYTLSKPIHLYVGTELRGDPLNRPVLKAAPGLKLMVQGGDLNQQAPNNFMISVRNIVFDSSNIDSNIQVRLLDWPVSQGSTLINCYFKMPVGSRHIGLTMQGSPDAANSGGGSPIIISDNAFTGGENGMVLDNQQYTLKGLSFKGCHTGLNITSVFVATLHDLHFDSCGTGVSMEKGAVSGGASFIDCFATNTGTVIHASYSGSGAGSVILDNIRNDAGALTFLSGPVALKGYVASHVMGNQYMDNNNAQTDHFMDRDITVNRPLALLSGFKYYVKKQPQYANYDISQFASVKGAGAKGDGRTDDTDAINKALHENAQNCKITFFPHGLYKVKGTVMIPPGSRVVGEFMSVISGSGSYFEDESNPKPVVQVGIPGHVGVAELSDLVLTIDDALSGAILLEVNMAGAKPGDVSIHNVHQRIGGTKDSRANDVCGTSARQCKAGFLMMHITKTAQVYIENMWGWAADHSLDGGSNGYVGTGRGYLVEATKGTWLMGVAPEHVTLYGINLVNAQNVYLSLEQFETPYWQPTPMAPSPWTVNSAYNDPDFSNCAADDTQCHMAWPLRIQGGSQIMVYATGFWTFFNSWDGRNYVGNCAGKYCQTNGVGVENSPTSTYLFNINTKQIKNLVYGSGSTGKGPLAEQKDNPGSWPSAGGVLAAYLGFSG